MSAHYFISDAHLGAAPAETERRLLSFLESIQGRADSLFILGDLFDFWFEYGRAIPKHGFAVLAQLRQLARGGTRVAYLAGNHDLRFLEFFERELGIEIGHERCEILDGRRVWIDHGDEVDRRPVSRLFRRLMRSRLNNLLYSLVHPDVGIRLAGWIARRSRARGPDAELREEMARVARTRLAEGYDLVVMGHLHLPDRRDYEEGVYLNTGDWLTNFTLAVVRDGEPTLETFGE